MKQSEKIANNFSDAFLVALLEGVDTSEVIRQFSKDYPEMESQFRANAASLELLYGDIRTSGEISENEISTAYQKVSERLGSPAPAKTVLASKPGFFAQMRMAFSSSPMWAGASLGIGVAVVIALLWQPWVIKQSMKETAEHAAPSTVTPSTPQAQQQFAVNDEPSVDPMKMPEVRYRGKDTKQMLSTTQKRMQDSIDAARLKAMATPKALAAPTDLHLEPLSPGAIFIRWKAVEGALSYIVEWKTENDENFKPVTQISQTGTRITSLESGKTYFVRVIAASGERTGPASDAKSIVVP